MGFITLIVYIALIWLLVWAIKSVIPMEEAGSKAITVVAVVMTVLLVLWAFGLLPMNLNTPVRLR